MENNEPKKVNISIPKDYYENFADEKQKFQGRIGRPIHLNEFFKIMLDTWKTQAEIDNNYSFYTNSLAVMLKNNSIPEGRVS